jgi:hypothetical protein
MAQAVDDAIAKVPQLKPVRELAKWLALERFLAATCAITPFLLVIFDGGEVRESISAYYAMGENQVFYFFLTIASMLFVSNGVLKDGHWYNVALGVLLAGVVLFNTDDHQIVHKLFAIAFFAGNAVTILLFSRGSWIKGGDQRRFKLVFVAVVVLAVVLWQPFEVITLFWAEWLSLVAIAIHFLLDASPKSAYRASKREVPAAAA